MNSLVISETIVREDERAAPSSPRSILLRGLGVTMLAIGGLGMVLPVLPTTVFWILAAACFAKSSPALYAKIRSHPRFGRAISDFLDHGVIARPSKMAAFIGMAIGAGLLMISQAPMFVVLGGLAVIVASAVYVGLRPEILTAEPA